MVDRKIIWRYWEGTKPAYIERLAEQPLRYCSGDVEIIYLSPETVPDYISDLPKSVHKIREPAHRADIIRSFLLKKYGGAWLDADILVVKNIDWLFELDKYSLLSFNKNCKLHPSDKLRIGVLSAKPDCPIITKWNEEQVRFITRMRRHYIPWTRIGADMITKAAFKHPYSVKILSLEDIEPFPWSEVNILYNQHPIDLVVHPTTSMISFHNSRLFVKEFEPDMLGYKLLEEFA